MYIDEILIMMVVLIFLGFFSMCLWQFVRQMQKEKERRQKGEKMLTEQDACGNWCVKGLPWKDICIGQSITENTNEKIYGALFKLKDYEDSGLSPEEVEKLKERDTARSVKERYRDQEKMCETVGYGCPNRCRIEIKNSDRFCPMCGQRLKW